jgi:DNA repair protein RadC
VEQPRDRLLRSGPKALSDAELIAVLLRGGRPGASGLDISRELLFEAGGLRGLANSCARSLRRRGVGKVKIATLLAAVEVACRMAAAAVPAQEPLSRPAEVCRYLDLRYGRGEQEIMGALYVNARHRLVSERELFRGTLHRCSVEPREVLREGLLVGAAGLVLFHTHPSGDPAPSREDLLFTRRMARAGEVVGVAMVDHLIVGTGGAWVSLRERGGWQGHGGRALQRPTPPPCRSFAFSDTQFVAHGRRELERVRGQMSNSDSSY